MNGRCRASPAAPVRSGPARDERTPSHSCCPLWYSSRGSWGAISVRPGAVRAPNWSILGPILVHFWSQRPLGAHPGPCWKPFWPIVGSQGAPWGPSWTIFEAILAHGGLQGGLGGLVADSAPPQEAILDRSGVHLGPPSGPILGPFWVRFWIFFLVSFWSRPGHPLGPILGPFWGPFWVQKWAKNRSDTAPRKDPFQGGVFNQILVPNALAAIYKMLIFQWAS